MSVLQILFAWPTNCVLGGAPRKDARSSIGSALPTYGNKSGQAIREMLWSISGPLRLHFKATNAEPAKGAVGAQVQISLQSSHAGFSLIGSKTENPKTSFFDTVTIIKYPM